ncbi:MAG: hypothetical protein A2297_03455 [Elusimicrobia bacterium RIFOXYB2_FULL_48_7]|nr:MAG: hypothetical protein A2297_03455 [Elusimicrobia bacterium RIFOXYB2_FULL_48_7]
MKKIVFLLFLVLLSCLNARAEVNMTGATGGTPGYFLNLGLGSRALSMGRGFAALSDDSSAVYWNPAGLSRLKYSEMSLSHFNLFEGTSYDSFSFARPLKGSTFYGMGVIRLYTGGLDVTDVNNVQTGATLFEQDTAIFISGSASVYKNLYCGINMKNVNKTFDDINSNWFGADLSALYEFSEILSFGMNLQNLVSINNSIPVNAKAGILCKLLEKRLNIVVDTDKTALTPFQAHAGVEFFINDMFCARAGYDNGNAAAGFGVKFKDFLLDYAVLGHYMDYSSRATFSYRFSGPPEPAELKKPAAEPVIIKKEKIPDYEIEVNTMKEIPTSVYHLFKDRNISVINLQVKNNSKKETKFIIKYGIGSEKQQEIKETSIAPMEKISLNLTPVLSTDEIKKIETVPTPSNILIEIEKITGGDQTRPVFKQFYPVTLLPYDQFSPKVTDAKNETFDLIETLAGWITYNDRTLSEVLSKASDKGAALNPQVKIIGFQAPNVFTSRPVDNRSLAEKEADYRQQIKLLYDTLKDDYKITYLNQPVAYGESQRIKLPYSVLSNKGNCIELALLFASLLESIEIDPIIAIFPEEKHATVGYKVYGDGKDKCILLETNVFGEDFDRVFTKGRELVERYNLKTEFDDIVPFDESGIYKKGTSVIVFDIKKIRSRIPPSPYIPR